jgi:hypothetical protein
MDVKGNMTMRPENKILLCMDTLKKNVSVSKVPIPYFLRKMNINSDCNNRNSDAQEFPVVLFYQPSCVVRN